MKKVLLGLLALSAVSMATPITNATMNADGVNETSVFNQGDKGIVNVEGSMVSKVPVLKYVIYAGNAEGTIMEDELVLPDFIMADRSRAGFDKSITINNIYVKKIIANGKTEADTPTFGEFSANEKVKFKVNLDPFYTDISNISKPLAVGVPALEFQALAFMSKTALQDLANSMNATPYWQTLVASKFGLLQGTIDGKYCGLGKTVFVESKINGELSFRDGFLINKRPEYVIGDLGTLTQSATDVFLENFSKKKPFTDVTVEAVVENI